MPYSAAFRLHFEFQEIPAFLHKKDIVRELF